MAVASSVGAAYGPEVDDLDRASRAVRATVGASWKTVVRTEAIAYLAVASACFLINAAQVLEDQALARPGSVDVFVSIPGGLFLSWGLFALLAPGLVVRIREGITELWNRVLGTSRPLERGLEGVFAGFGQLNEQVGRAREAALTIRVVWIVSILGFLIAAALVVFALSSATGAAYLAADPGSVLATLVLGFAPLALSIGVAPSLLRQLRVVEGQLRRLQAGFDVLLARFGGRL